MKDMYRVTIRGDETELRGHASADALRWLADSVGAPYVVVASPVDDHGTPCTTKGCPGDGRYPAPGRDHLAGCSYPAGISERRRT